MGENAKETDFYILCNGKEIKFDGIQTVSKDGVCHRADIPLWHPNGVFTATMRIRFPRSRKRFVKFLMSNGVSRNQAQRLAEGYHRHGYSWYRAFLDATLGI